MLTNAPADILQFLAHAEIQVVHLLPGISPTQPELFCIDVLTAPPSFGCESRPILNNIMQPDLTMTRFIRVLSQRVGRQSRRLPASHPPRNQQSLLLRSVFRPPGELLGADLKFGCSVVFIYK